MLLKDWNNVLKLSSLHLLVNFLLENPSLMDNMIFLNLFFLTIPLLNVFKVTEYLVLFTIMLMLVLPLF